MGCWRAAGRCALLAPPPARGRNGRCARAARPSQVRGRLSLTRCSLLVLCGALGFFPYCSPPYGSPPPSLPSSWAVAPPLLTSGPGQWERGLVSTDLKHRLSLSPCSCAADKMAALEEHPDLRLQHSNPSGKGCLLCRATLLWDPFSVLWGMCDPERRY